jgi:hypothetical protein
MFGLLRYLFAGRRTAGQIPAVVSADLLNAEHPRFHQLRKVNGRPSKTQLGNLLAATGKAEFEFREAGGDRYHFRLTPAGGAFRIDILGGPSYGNRLTDSHSTHRHGVGSPVPCICIKSGFEPRNAGAAAGIAIDWAKRTSRYIRDGQPWNS